MNTHALKNALLQYLPEGKRDDSYRLDMISLLTRAPQQWWQRSLLTGHFTASAWVINPDCTEVLLLHHAKLDRWLQPGGHLDPTDASPAAGALREAREETGLTNLRLLDEAIFDVDIHTIPARGEEPQHLHYDLRYLVEAPSFAVLLSTESLGFRALALADLLAGNGDESLKRPARRTLQRHGNQPS